MTKFFYYFFPIVMIIIFIFIMISGPVLKQPMGKNDNVEKYIEVVKNDLKNEKWSHAIQDQRHLKTAWEKVVTRIQFSSERDEINDINYNLARLNGFIEANDRAGGLAELSELKKHWSDIGF